MTRTDTVVLWILRVAWVTLPVSAGLLVDDAASSWSAPVARVVVVAAWATWAIVLLALLAPRPVGCTALRIVATGYVVGAHVLAFTSDASTLTKLGASVGTAVAFVLAITPAPALACAAGAAYGDEVRFPLRVPPSLFLGPIELAVAATTVGAVAGPLLLAARQWIAGVILLAAGWLLAAVGFRSLHALHRRWAVLVPAGLALVDPTAMADPVLFRREHVRLLDALDGPAPDGVVDTRLGAARGGVVLALDAPTDLVGLRRGRASFETVSTGAIAFAVVHRDQLLATASLRRLHVQQT